jgi:hypothetical protein
MPEPRLAAICPSSRIDMDVPTRIGRVTVFCVYMSDR